MPMPPYPIYCHHHGCGNLALYKIAARWSDGVTEELKTYSLCCRDCLPEEFLASRKKQAVCRLTAGEVLESPGIYRVEHGRRDPQLERLSDVEHALRLP